MEKEIKKCHTDLLNANAFRFKNESERILSACMAAHRELGCGFLEPVYQEALPWEFTLQNIPFEKEWKRVTNFKSEIPHGFAA